MAVYKRATKKSFIKDGLTFYYWVTGDTSKPPALIIPGLGATHADLLLMTYRLRNTFYFIIPDLPGWGMSPRLNAGITIHEYAIFLASLLNHEKITKINIIGHCMGATLAIEFASQYPAMARKLFLISPPYEEGTLGYQLLLKLLEIDHHAPKFLHNVFYFWHNREFSFLMSFFVLKFKTMKKIINVSVRNFKVNGREDVKNLEENWESVLGFDYHKISKLDCPVHLIYGSRDFYIPQAQAKKLHALIPSASLDFIENAGHLPPVETPETVASLILHYA